MSSDERKSLFSSDRRDSTENKRHSFDNKKKDEHKKDKEKEKSDLKEVKDDQNVFRRAMTSSGNFMKSLGKSTVKTLTTPPSFLNFSQEKSAEKQQEEDNEALMILGLLRDHTDMFDLTNQPVIPSTTLTGYRRIKKECIDNKDFLFMICSDSIFLKSVRFDCWSSFVLPVEKWIVPSKGKSLVPTEITTEGWNIENNSLCTTYETPLERTKIVNFEEDFPWYKKFFYTNGLCVTTRRNAAGISHTQRR